MTISTSASTQDYVKAIWKLHEWHHMESNPASLEQYIISPSDLANETGMRASTVSGALARMTDQGFVMHAPYGGIQLTEKGRALAIQMLRRHRIIETYLVHALGYTWDEVHEEAEALEHVASSMMIERMEEHLGFPDRDPHGDPIPDRAGDIPQFDTINVNLVPVGARAVISRVNDDHTDLLHILQEHNAMIDSTITVKALTPTDIVLQSDEGEAFCVKRADADYIRVSRIA
ncbi:metal-dependent transcriptional regulator [Alloscardovia criceti]|uniref:metal-dependent transcriptional regulator n=1 Tax=Alloscardovia criceti TaxID=356828 RepID=UPI00036BA461|nr:metal-dependent transcriptional regulator [Alloscardovia criceti]